VTRTLGVSVKVALDKDAAVLPAVQRIGSIRSDALLGGMHDPQSEFRFPGINEWQKARG
jgi:hypothetical protein